MAVTEGAISEEDRAKIIAAATDYIESWLDGDAERMGRCLHPELAKRDVNLDPKTGSYVVDTMSRAQMVEYTAKGYGKKYARDYEIMILDAYNDLATVRVFSAAYVDHVQLARFGDRWLLLNVLWQRRPGR